MPIFSRGATKNKLILLYYVRLCGFDITREQLYRAMIETDAMSYFDFASCMHELEEDGYLAAVPQACGQVYRVSVKGIDTLEEFIESLPVSLRNALDRYASSVREQMRQQTQIVSETEALESGGYLVRLRALEGKSIILELDVRLATQEMAQRACRNWAHDSEEIYADIMQRLLQTRSETES